VPSLADGFCARPETAADLAAALVTGAVVVLVPARIAGEWPGGWLESCGKTQLAGEGRAWPQPEIEAVESLAGDIGRGLEHARLYEGEKHLVAELESLGQAKASFLPLPRTTCGRH
jgi:GAF domain-containing protein